MPKDLEVSIEPARLTISGKKGEQGRARRARPSTRNSARTKFFVWSILPAEVDTGKSGRDLEEWRFGSRLCPRRPREGHNHEGGSKGRLASLSGSSSKRCGLICR